MTMMKIISVMDIINAIKDRYGLLFFVTFFYNVR